MESLILSTKEHQEVFYRRSGKGPAVMLLHGFPEDGELWEPVRPMLEESFTILIPDIPGAGRSTLYEPFSLESAAGDLKRILDQEGIDRVVLVGHSMGGYIALAFSELFSNVVAGLSLVHSTATADTEEKKETRRKAIGLIRKGGKEQFVKGMIPNLFSARFKTEHPEVLERQISRGLKLGEESMIAFYNAMINRPDRTSTLREANFPVGWIVGKEDSVVPFSSALQQSRLARINFISVYSDTGHMSMIENAGQLAGDLREFIGYCHNR